MAKAKSADPVGQMLTLAARRHRVRSAALLGEVGLFPGQDQVLRALSTEDGRTMGQIAELLSIRPPTASKMVSRMEGQGLLARRERNTDGRLVAVYITEAGQDRVAEIDRIAKRVEREALGGLDDKDARRLRRLLKKVARNLSREPHLDGDDAEDIDDRED